MRTFVIYANRVARELDVASYGGSMIIGPDDEMVAAAGRYVSEFIVAELDLPACAPCGTVSRCSRTRALHSSSGSRRA